MIALSLTVDEALAYAAEFTTGATMHADSRGVSATMLVLADAVRRQHAEITALRADAERYRWLRDCAPSIWYGDEFLDAIDGKLDSAIDAAMKQEASIDTALVADEGRRP